MHQRRRRQAARFFSRLTLDEQFCLLIGGTWLLNLHRRSPADAWVEQSRIRREGRQMQAAAMFDAINRILLPEFVRVNVTE